MTADEAFEILQVEKEFIETAGPAVLRLKLMEIGSLCRRRLAGDEAIEAARTAAQELRRLIAERPCVSLVDFKARDKVLEASAAPQGWAKTSGWTAVLASPFFRKRVPKETALSAHRNACREDLARIVGDADLDQRDVVALDYVLTKGSSPRDLREFSFLMTGMFDSPSEPTRFVKRANELANRYAAALGGESKSEQGVAARELAYKKSA